MKRYPSNRSLLMGLLAWGIPSIPLGIILSEGAFYPLLLVILVPIYFLIGYVTLGISYIIESDQLIIKIGRLTGWKIKINEISSITRSYSPLSSPAGSIVRLKLKISGSSLMISPRHERDFIENLREINPKIQGKIDPPDEKGSTHQISSLAFVIQDRIGCAKLRRLIRLFSCRFMQVINSRIQVPQAPFG